MTTRGPILATSVAAAEGIVGLVPVARDSVATAMARPPVNDIVTDLHPHDVILGRGAPYAYYVGNVTFCALVATLKADYTVKGRRHCHKQAVAKRVLDQVHASGGRFLAKVRDSSAVAVTPDGGATNESPPMSQRATWKRVSCGVAMEKIKQALRTKDAPCAPLSVVVTAAPSAVVAVAATASLVEMPSGETVDLSSGAETMNLTLDEAKAAGEDDDASLHDSKNGSTTTTVNATAAAFAIATQVAGASRQISTAESALNVSAKEASAEQHEPPIRAATTIVTAISAAAANATDSLEPSLVVHPNVSLLPTSMVPPGSLLWALQQAQHEQAQLAGLRQLQQRDMELRLQLLLQQQAQRRQHVVHEQQQQQQQLLRQACQPQQRLALDTNMGLYIPNLLLAASQPPYMVQRAGEAEAPAPFWTGIGGVFSSTTQL